MVTLGTFRHLEPDIEDVGGAKKHKKFNGEEQKVDYGSY